VWGEKKETGRVCNVGSQLWGDSMAVKIKNEWETQSDLQCGGMCLLGVGVLN